MPGLDYNELPHSTITTPAPVAPMAVDAVDPANKPSVTTDSAVYYNPRLDPKNYLEGPLSHNPATRLRQMLARPGIVVSLHHCVRWPVSNRSHRSHPVSATVSRRVAQWKPALNVYIRGKTLCRLFRRPNAHIASAAQPRLHPVSVCLISPSLL